MTLRGFAVLLIVTTLAIPIVATLATSPANATVAPADTYVVQPPQSSVIESVGFINVDASRGIGFQTQGRIRDLYVSEGIFVQAGDILAVLENERERVAVANAEVSLALATAQRDDLLVVDEDEIRLSEARVQSAMDSYGSVRNQVTPEDIRAAELNVQRTQDALNAAQDARIRGGGGMSDEGVALLDAQVGEASFDAAIAQLQLEDLRTINQPSLGAAAANIRQQEAQMARLLAGPTEYEVMDANLAVSAAENALADAQTDFARTVLRAPGDGLVSDITVETGQTVRSGEIIMKLIDTDPLFAVAEVDEINLPLLSDNTETEVTLDALPGYSFPAVIDTISPAGDERRGVVIFEASVRLLEPDPRIRPGMTARTRFTLAGEGNLLAIPARFLQTDSRGAYVLVRLDDGSIEQHTVTTGAQKNSSIEISSGLNVGDTLIATNAASQ